MLKGIDVSAWQRTIDWGKVKNDGIQFAMLRASYGQKGIDKCFKKNVQGAKDAGVQIGAYHYCYATTVAGAKAEARHFLDIIKGIQFEYPICLDIEDKCQAKISAETLTDMAIAFLEVLEGAGYFAAIYANRSWFTSRLNMKRLKPYTIWLAQWRVDKPSFTPGIWQYTSDGKVAGIKGRVDLDVSYNDYETIIKKAGLNGFNKPASNSDPKPQPTKPAAPKMAYYIVKPGDNLTKIAKIYSTTVNAICRLNPQIKNPNLIFPKQKIRVK